MFVRVKSTKNSPRKSVQIVHSRRLSPQKVSQIILRHVGVANNDEELQELINLGNSIIVQMEKENQFELPFLDADSISPIPSQKKKNKPLPPHEVKLSNLVHEQRVILGIHDIYGKLFDELGFSSLLDKNDNQILKNTVLARIANPQSKLATCDFLERDFGLKLSVDSIYRMMDKLSPITSQIQSAVRRATHSLFPDGVDVIFFDVTTLYFESFNEDSLRGFGYSKDQKYHVVQVVLALATTERGLPIGYKLFHGTTAEISTLMDCLNEWKSIMPIQNVVFVADRGMMSEDNIKLLEANHIEYIVGASLKKLPKKKQNEILNSKQFKLSAIQNDMVWNHEFELTPKRRLICAYSGRRAQKDAKDRTKLIDKLEKKLGKKGALKKLVSNRGYLKFTKTDGNSVASINNEKIERDALFDGMYGILTNSQKDRAHILTRYRGLFTIEQAFRITKHDLMMRPIFHFKKERIEAHVALCYLAYSLIKHAEHRIRIQQHEMSPEQIRFELCRVDATLVRDKQKGGLYKIPSSMNEKQKAIYRAFNVKRSLTPTLAG